MTNFLATFEIDKNIPMKPFIKTLISLINVNKII